jgi:hypothetical protein
MTWSPTPRQRVMVEQLANRAADLRILMVETCGAIPATVASPLELALRRVREVEALVSLLATAGEEERVER